MTFLFYIVNVIVADDLTTQGARASVAMILTYLNKDNSVPVYEGLRTDGVDYNGA